MTLTVLFLTTIILFQGSILHQVNNKLEKIDIEQRLKIENQNKVIVELLSGALVDCKIIFEANEMMAKRNEKGKI